MSSGFLHEEIIHNRFLEGRQFWYGLIAQDVPARNIKCWVILPDFAGPDYQIGPCFWQSRDIDHVDTTIELHGDPVTSATATNTIVRTLPSKGDRCIFMWDNRRQPWVIAWWPYSD